MKKWIIGALCGSLLAIGGAASANSTDAITLIVNDREIETDVPPQIINGRVMVPVRAISEELGATVAWDEQQKQVVIQRQGPKPIAEAEQTMLYALRINDGMYSPLLLEHEGQFHLFDWESVTNPTYAPTMLQEDVTGDGRNELIVILTTGYGTGTRTEDIHVLSNMNEIDVADPVEWIKNHTQSSVTNETVDIVINGKTITIPTKEIPVDPSNLYSAVAVGNIVTYEWHNQTLQARVPAQISPAHFVGEFLVTYQYTNNQLSIADIAFSLF